jgi:hypothetical protein
MQDEAYGYRVLVHEEEPDEWIWLRSYTRGGGPLGIYESITSAKKGMAHAFGKQATGYKIYKIYLGIDPQWVQPPKMVYQFILE